VEFFGSFFGPLPAERPLDVSTAAGSADDGGDPVARLTQFVSVVEPARRLRERDDFGWTVDSAPRFEIREDVIGARYILRSREFRDDDGVQSVVNDRVEISFEQPGIGCVETDGDGLVSVPLLVRIGDDLACVFLLAGGRNPRGRR